MRFYSKPKPEIGALREQTFFAVLPVIIKGETRWLETVTVQQWYGFVGWRNRQFLNQ